METKKTKAPAKKKTVKKAPKKAVAEPRKKRGMFGLLKGKIKENGVDIWNLSL